MVVEDKSTLKGIQKTFFRAQFVLIVSLALFLGVAGTLINIHFEKQKRDQNLQNVAQAVAQSPLLTTEQEDNRGLHEYLDSLLATLDDIDVISVINLENLRVYHSNPELIGTVYDGTQPDFASHQEGYYTMNDSGPSGVQRRAYAAIYDEEGNYKGFVIAIMLMQNVQKETLQTALIFILITITAILIELLITKELSGKIKRSLLGYEPGVFAAMYKIRDGILESLDEGIIAVDTKGVIRFANHAAVSMLEPQAAEGGGHMTGKSIRDYQLETDTLLADHAPIKENGERVGEIVILHDRAEYTKLMEDLTGTRYLVDSMRANTSGLMLPLHTTMQFSAV